MQIREYDHGVEIEGDNGETIYVEGRVRQIKMRRNAVGCCCGYRLEADDLRNFDNDRELSCPRCGITWAVALTGVHVYR
jgi:hypothetical protein